MVIITRRTALFVFVAALNTEILLRRRLSYSLSMMYSSIEADIAHFLNENPNPDVYCPTGRTNRIYELMMDIHSGNLKQALDKIDLFKANPIGVGFRGPKGYDYEYIERWINEQER